MPMSLNEKNILIKNIYPCIKLANKVWDNYCTGPQMIPDRLTILNIVWNEFKLGQFLIAPVVIFKLYQDFLDSI